MRRLTVRARLLLALGLLALATLTVGAVAWAALTRATDRLEHLHDKTLTGVDRALTLSRKAADLATLAPYLLTLDSPFRIAQEGAQATGLVDAITLGLPQDDALRTTMVETRSAIAALVRETSLRAGLRDRALRLNAELARAERRFAALSARPAASLTERQDWLVLQSLSASLLGAGRAENLIGVGEFQREYVTLLGRTGARNLRYGSNDLPEMRAIAEGPQGLFELRRLELARQIGAEAALVRIRQGAAAVTAHSAAATAEAQGEISAERARTTTAIGLAKTTILLVGLASAGLALVAALYVSGYVTGNLRAISDAMMRLASGDRQTRMARGEGQGDEIGKLLYAFRVFRSNALRLDRSHRQMAQRTALYENMMAGISDGVAILSDQGQIVARNDTLAQVLRVDPSAFVGRPALGDVIAAGGWQASDGIDGFASLTSPDGYHAERRESPLPGGGLVVLISDVTQRRQMDDRLRQIQRIEALGKISGEVAHDFGNILSTISGNLHMMNNTPPDRQEALRHTIGRAVDLGMSLTGRLLSFARRQQLEPETVDLPGLVDGMADLIGFALRDEVELIIQTDCGPMSVRVDPGQLESALLNLCLNASQAIEGAGRVTLRVRQEGDQAVIEVEDNGAGMTPEVQAQAMEPFYSARADGTGTGLGLAMVYGFIRQSGGDIQIISARKKGTTVRLTLPMDAGAVQDRDQRQFDRILLVEDDPTDRELAQRRLGPLCALLDTAQEPDAAMDAMAQPLDLIVTDLTLQGEIEGWRLAEAALTLWPECHAIVISGHLPQVDPLSSRFPGRVQTLAKPLTPEAVTIALSRQSWKDHDDSQRL